MNKPLKHFLVSFAIAALSCGLLAAPQAVHAAAVIRPAVSLSLAGYWPMNQRSGTTADDVSGNSHHGSIANGAWVPGARDGGLQLSGSGSRVAIAHTAALNMPAGGITVTAWIKPVSASGKYTLLAKGRYGYHWNYGMGISAGKLFARHNNGDVVSNASAITAGEWQHVAVVYSGGNDYFYVNGNLVETVADGGWSEQTGTQQLTLGAAYNAAGTYGEVFNGNIDEVRVYGRGLDNAEMARLAKVGSVMYRPASGDGLIGHWSMNEGRGDKAGDSSGLGHHGTLMGANGLPAWTTGKRGGAMSFDGADDHVDAGNPTTLVDTTDVTMSAWIKPRALNSIFNRNIVISGRRTEIGQPYSLVISPDKVGISFQTDNTANGAIGWVNKYGITNIPLNQWSHIVAIREGTNLLYYKNGEFLGSNTYFAGNIMPGNGVTIGKGYNGGAFYFDGEIDDVRIYNRALSAAEIKTIYGSGEVKINASQNSKLTDGLIGLWSFNGPDVSGSTAYDRSGNGYHGTISNAKPEGGRVGQALNFLGMNKSTYVNLGSNAALNPAVFTITAWVNPRNISGPYNYILSSARDCCGTYNGLEFMLAYNKLSLTIWKSSPSNMNSATTISNDSGWVFVAATYDGSHQKLYINGNLDDTKSYTGGVGTPASYNVTLGGMGMAPGTYEMDGVIDEVRLYGRALTAAEIKQLYDLAK